MKEHLSLKVWMAVAVTMIGVAIASPARADERILAKVPFDFIVGRSQFPAGDYVITEASASGVLSIANADNRHFAFVLTNADSPRGETQPELVFERLGGVNFLSRISDGLDLNREIPLTRSMMDRERQVAMNREHQVVVVAANR